MGKHRALQPLRDSDFIRTRYADGQSIPQLVEAIPAHFGVHIDRATVRRIMAEQGIEVRRYKRQQSILTDAQALRRFRELEKTVPLKRDICRMMMADTGLSAFGVQSQIWRAKEVGCETRNDVVD